MKKYLMLILLLSINLQAQSSFEGKIKFVNRITMNEKVPADFEKKLNDRYGDSIEMYYSKKGYFKRRYINTGDFGNGYQIYLPENGRLVVVKNNKIKIDTGSVFVNSLELVSVTKIHSEKIMNLDCECYEYKALTNKKRTQVVLTYCFSKTLPRLDPNLFKTHKDFFLSDFYNKSERPYLKFSMKVPDYTITYIATEFKEKPIDDIEFQIQ